ncbi:MAG: motility protein A [Elusimicrobiota bacterium]|nr:motility protein A [Endomicrobiia bacterium]MDW8166281.1 motility protein A [Elusimicrobiota bacterium]
MDITTLIGAIAGFLLIAFGIMLRGTGGIDFTQFIAFFNFPSILITFGGAICATLINYPLSQVVGVLKVVKKVFTEPGESAAGIIEQFVSLCQKARKEGLLSLEDDIKKMDNDFMRRGLQMVIDGQDADFIRNLMETELAFIQERHKIGQEIFIALGTYSPAFGLIGTIIGLILMLRNLQDTAQIASGMAVALLTTFYGAMAAYLLFLPISGKLKRRSEEEIFIKEVIIRGVLLLQSGVTPSVMEANLQAYLSPALRKAAIAKEKAAREQLTKETKAESESTK